jgi:signal transduction histidine kinase/NO-binding membrane sensor protein with MHYT domain/DNA-binding response OmpR family regulator
MDWYNNFFLTGQMPTDIMTGHYNLKLVLLSYIIASITSFVALDMSSHLKKQNSNLFKYCWWLGGSIIMGAGIWSMHFVGMLAYEMDMTMTYSLMWTGLSMLVAVIAAGIAFLFFMMPNPKPIQYIFSGITLGIAIPAMHYTGMAGMQGIIIHYKPGLFWLSVLVAVVAATAALWLSVHSDKGSYARRIKLKIVSALIMGVAICGMHYTGMFAAVMQMAPGMEHGGAAADPTLLAVLITTIVLSILAIAFILSTTKYYVTNKVQNDNDFLEVTLNSLRGCVLAFDSDKKLRLYNRATKEMFENIDTVTHFSDEWQKQFPLYKLDNKAAIEGADYPLEMIFNGQKIKGMEALTMNSDGKDRVISIDGQQLFSQDGERLGAVVVYQDITERKHIDQMKNEFISTVSHELRTPLTSIRGSLGLIMGGAMGSVPQEMSSLLEIACNNSERLVRLINDILDTEKIESGKMVFRFVRTDVRKLVEQAVIANKSYADKYKVSYNIVGTMPTALARIDADRIRQVLDNLLSNAAKFSKAGGVIDVDLTVRNGLIRVSVSDTGSGIPMEFQSRIFSKFYQADSSDAREKGGTGLGLSICKSIVEAHKGTIGFHSTPNVGTTFYFELLEALPEKTQELEVAGAAANSKILICEDEPDVSKLLQLILRERGFSSVRVGSIAEAKKALQSQEFCLMTLDLLLPDGNGLELLQWMRGNPRLEKLPVVVISAISIEQEKIKGAALGVVDWINKPIDEDRLYNDVVHALGTRDKATKARVLHIEDDLDIAKIISTVLQDMCDTQIVTNVANAKKMLINMKYDLIILDLNLGGDSGYEILTYLDENRFSIPVVILSVDEPLSDVSKNIVASMVKSKVSNRDLLDKIVSILDSKKIGSEVK